MKLWSVIKTRFVYFTTVDLRHSSKEDEAQMMRKRDGQGEEDMIQMALRMAEEMSGPIEDLESSVEPVAVNSGF